MKSCRHVVAICSATALGGLTLKGACFRMKITLGFVLNRPWFVPYASQDVAGRFRSDLELTCFDKGRQDGMARLKRGFFPTKILGQLLCHSTLNFLGKLSDIIFLWSGNICFLCQVTLKMLQTILLFKCCKFSLIPQNCHFFTLKLLISDYYMIVFLTERKSICAF